MWLICTLSSHDTLCRSVLILSLHVFHVSFKCQREPWQVSGAHFGPNVPTGLAQNQRSHGGHGHLLLSSRAPRAQGAIDSIGHRQFVPSSCLARLAHQGTQSGALLQTVCWGFVGGWARRTSSSIPPCTFGNACACIEYYRKGGTRSSMVDQQKIKK